MDSLHVAAIQMNSQGDVGSNLSRASELLKQAAAGGAKIALLPENFALMGEDGDKRRFAEDLDAGSGPIWQMLSSVARDLRIAIIAGGLPERSPDPTCPFNTCAVFGDSGELLTRYRKIHMFDVDLADGTCYRESASTAAGESVVVAEIAGARVGLSVCYDLRFPELYRELAKRGAEVLVVPAAFTLLTGKDHWHVLLRARAIEAQAYVVAAGQWGKHPRGRTTYGKSCIIDPWGEVIAQASEGEGVVFSTIDLTYLERVRRSLPSLQHRRL